MHEGLQPFWRYVTAGVLIDTHPADGQNIQW